MCVFEHIYFARPDQTWDGINVHHVRQRLGEELAREMGNGFTKRIKADERMRPTDVAVDERMLIAEGATDKRMNDGLADVVIPVPDSSIPAAIGFSHLSGIPYNDGFIKNRYVGRTFIEPTDSLRKRGVALKFNVIQENILGKRVVMIDDSIVRGNTMGPLIKLLRNAGAKEVHVAITCPPIAHPCFMGVDMGKHEDLIAHKRTVNEICEHVGADSLHYLSVQGMMRAVQREEGFCQACFTGQYPIPVDFSSAKTGFERGSK
jgi:amidophosphoribosyltransferase